MTGIFNRIFKKNQKNGETKKLVELLLDNDTKETKTDSFSTTGDLANDSAQIYEDDANESGIATELINDSDIRMYHDDEENDYDEEQNHDDQNGIVFEEEFDDEGDDFNYIFKNKTYQYEEKIDSDNLNKITRWKIRKISESGLIKLQYILNSKEEAIDKIKNLSQSNIQLVEKNKQGIVISTKKITKN